MYLSMRSNMLPIKGDEIQTRIAHNTQLIPVF
jgi:hypothetical protein